MWLSLAGKIRLILYFWSIKNAVAFESSTKIRFSTSCNLKAVKLPWHCPFRRLNLWSSPLILLGFACCCCRRCWCYSSECNRKWINCHRRKHLKGSEQGKKKCWTADSEGDRKGKRRQMSFRKIRVGSIYIWHAAWLSWSFNWDAQHCIQGLWCSLGCGAAQRRRMERKHNGSHFTAGKGLSKSWLLGCTRNITECS